MVLIKIQTHREEISPPVIACHHHVIEMYKNKNTFLTQRKVLIVEKVSNA